MKGNLRRIALLGLTTAGIGLAGWWVTHRLPASSREWVGLWTGQSWPGVEEYSLRIEPRRGNLHFSLEAYSGTHSGSIEGTLQVDGTRATWQEEHAKEDPPFTSRLTFTRQGDRIHVAAENTEYYGGVGICFDDRTFFQGPARPMDYPLVEHNLLTREEEDRVKQLTGNDYSLLVTCLQLARVDEVQDKDFHGKVVDGFVRGAAPDMNARITIEKNGAITVGVTDCEKKQIRIHTTRPDGETPTPFNSWETAKFPVIYIKAPAR